MYDTGLSLPMDMVGNEVIEAIKLAVKGVIVSGISYVAQPFPDLSDLFYVGVKGQRPEQNLAVCMHEHAPDVIDQGAMYRKGQKLYFGEVEWIDSSPSPDEIDPKKAYEFAVDLASALKRVLDRLK